MVPFFEGMTKMNLRFWILQTLLLMLHIPFFHLPLLVSIQTPISQLRPYINRYAFMTPFIWHINCPSETLKERGLLRLKMKVWRRRRKRYFENWFVHGGNWTLTQYNREAASLQEFFFQNFLIKNNKNLYLAGWGHFFFIIQIYFHAFLFLWNRSFLFGF